MRPAGYRIYGKHGIGGRSRSRDGTTRSTTETWQPSDCRGREGRHSMIARRRAGAGQGLLRDIPDACRHRIGELIFVLIEGDLA